jgi:hypothetical protein
MYLHLFLSLALFIISVIDFSPSQTARPSKIVSLCLSSLKFYQLSLCVQLCCSIMLFKEQPYTLTILQTVGLANKEPCLNRRATGNTERDIVFGVPILLLTLRPTRRTRRPILVCPLPSDLSDFSNILSYYISSLNCCSEKGNKGEVCEISPYLNSVPKLVHKPCQPQ